jgi:hypothetical protein
MVFPGKHPARRQGTAFLCHTFDVAPELDFLGEQRGSRAPVLFAFVGEAKFTLLRQFACRFELLRAHASPLLIAIECRPGSFH